MSFVPRIFKLNVVKTLLHRCYVIFSDWSVFHEEINFLIKFLTNNGYRRYLIDNCISKFLNHTFQPPTHAEERITTYYLKLPYYGHLSYVIRKQLDKLLKNNFPNVRFRFVFSNPFTFKLFFPFKDRISPVLRSNAVYQFKCLTCKCQYIGKTGRNLTLRYAEHRGMSPKTGRLLHSPTIFLD